MSPSLSKSPNAQPRAACGVVDAGSAERGNFLKLAVAQIAVQILVLGIRRVDMGAIDLGIDVPVRDENVEPAVVVHVKETDTPAEIARVDAQAREIGVILERAVAQIEI